MADAEKVVFMPRLLPEEGDLDMDNLLISYPSYTHKLDLARGRIRGFVDGMDAIRQAVYKLMATPAGVYPIYSPGYGLFFQDLIGLDPDLAQSEIKRRIRESAVSDDRIRAVEDFAFRSDGDSLSFTCSVVAKGGASAVIEGSVDLS
jgi:hypothetical protein